LSSLDITDDWQQHAKRASDAEHELANQRRQLNRVWKENRRLRLVMYQGETQLY
jgi:hypothetical protein